MGDPLQRYSRQILFAGIGADGQERIASSTVVVIGLGALGTVSATYLARAGVGHLRLIDRDLVEESNLQRQILYSEADARSHLPKAAAAEARLQQANSEIDVEGRVADVTPSSIDGLLQDADVIVDGTDNFETRYLVNEWCVQKGVPWIYGAAVGAYGLTLSVLPGEGPCLSCVFESAPPPELSPTCDTAGIIGPVAGVIASLQAAEALKIAAGRRQAVRACLRVMDLWPGHTQEIAVARRQDGSCPVCDKGEFPHLEARAGSGTVRLCGRNAVQITPRDHRPLDLEAVAERLAGCTEVSRNRFLVRAQVDGYRLTVFADGRSMVGGTDDPSLARSLVSRFVGA